MQLDGMLYHVSHHALFTRLSARNVLKVFFCLIIVLYYQLTNLLQSFSTAEGFIRGRSYNIRIDDQVLLRFSPKNSDSTYYFGDMVCDFYAGDIHILQLKRELECNNIIISDRRYTDLFS